MPPAGFCRTGSRVQAVKVFIRQGIRAQQANRLVTCLCCRPEEGKAGAAALSAGSACGDWHHIHSGELWGKVWQYAGSSGCIVVAKAMVSDCQSTHGSFCTCSAMHHRLVWKERLFRVALCSVAVQTAALTLDVFLVG